MDENVQNAQNATTQEDTLRTQREAIEARAAQEAMDMLTGVVRRDGHPDAPKPPAEAGAPPAKQEAAPDDFPDDGRKWVPLQGVLHERALKQERTAQRDEYRQALEGLGATFDDQGHVTPSAPADPQAMPQGGFGPPPSGGMPMISAPRLAELADQLGVEPNLLAQVGAEMMAPILSIVVAPLQQQAIEGHRAAWRARDPDFEVYAKSIDKHLAMFPPSLRSHPLAFELATKLSWADHKSEIIRRAQQPKKVVGSFTERAAPSTGEPGPSPLSSEAIEWAQRMGFPARVIDRAAELRESRQKQDR